ncbi:hypothetical protein PSH66_08455 [Pseudomonas sp. FP597]|uniref:hypothetical protein n=1 Tax=Pseudomonas sp. FP597 TaxID=2954096 RepID=UPI0027352A44|nr:hypothetical protein [Pseudomonas sp. FP597]WLI08346.1 hypothetical protein PSH66_08455 [Pseudomonas sp. FP597]
MKAFGFSAPVFAKFCAQKYNIKSGCNTVRLGTLYGYRTIENELLRDNGEGTFSYVLEFPTYLEASPQWLASFEFGGGGRVHIGDMQVANGNIKVKNLNVSGSTHNCWIYCISKSVESAGSITDAHADKWTIAADKLSGFANYIGSVLWSELTFQDLPPNLTEKYSLQEIQQRLSLNVEIKEVEYVDRFVLVKDPKEFGVSDIEELRDKVAFIKPVKFKDEQEVRIAFWLMFEGKKISIVDKPKSISLRPVDKLL